MTIGSKIAKMRTQKHMSQEELAEILSVSRQSISKWEMDQALPQLDKVIQLSDLFGLTTDALLRDEASLPTTSKHQEGTLRYFGTDGFRGEANEALTSMHAYRIGRFLGWYYASPRSGCEQSGYRPRIVIGKDTRRSSYMLEYSLVAGLTASGADAYMLHVTTTPSISYVTRQEGFDCGIMITASHNPYADNGIKLVNAHGEKLPDSILFLIEAYLDGDTGALGMQGELPLAKRERVGCIHDYISGRNRYIGYLISLASNSFKHLRIGLDCGNGAAWSIARAVFGALGTQMHIIGAEPDGLNINRDCGSTHTAALQALVRERHLDMGFAFDGDADRCIAIDENGNIVDGDAILYVLAHRLRGKGMLSHDTVVGTVMSNSGLARSLEKTGMHCVQTAVGDKSVYECMQQQNFCLGGEQSGHIIIKKYATTGDGLLTAILLAEEVCDTKSSLGTLVSPFKRLPQQTRSLQVRSRAAALQNPELLCAMEELRAQLGHRGRLLVRESGTENVIRVMAECEDAEMCKTCLERVVHLLADSDHPCESQI